MTSEVAAAPAEIAEELATSKLKIKLADLIEGALGEAASVVYDRRQAAHFDWAQRVFGGLPGVDVMRPRVRALRFLEEAIELYQAVAAADGVDLSAARCRARVLVNHVFDRAVGEPAQEVGGTMVTLMALCEAIDLSLDACERAEAQRLAAVDVEKLRARQLAKVEAGVEF